MPDFQFKALEQKIDDLIKLCAELNRENVSLKEAARSWGEERAYLITRHEMAKGKVEEILSRLKAVEQAK